MVGIALVGGVNISPAPTFYTTEEVAELLDETSEFRFWNDANAYIRSKYLLPLKIGIFFSTGDVATAVAEGTKAVGWTYSGHEFAETERYMGIFHEIAPAEQAVAQEFSDPQRVRDWREFYSRVLGQAPAEIRDGVVAWHGLGLVNPFDKDGQLVSIQLFYYQYRDRPVTGIRH